MDLPPEPTQGGYIKAMVQTYTKVFSSAGDDPEAECGEVTKFLTDYHAPRCAGGGGPVSCRRRC